MSLHSGLIVGHEKDRYRIHFAADLRAWGVVRGRLIYQAGDSTELPVVGDRVQCLAGDPVVIQEILPRRSLLVRKAAGEKGAQAICANVDFVLIATSLNQDLNFNRIDRYVTMIWDSGAQPVIVFTKSDLRPDWPEILREARIRFPGMEIHAVNQSEAHALERYVRGELCAVIVGSSGVGKSTLINFLLKAPKLKTSAIRDQDDKGRHTTTSRSMWRVPAAGWIIDTPGLRELQLMDFDSGLDQAFGEITEIEQHCRFGNCAHVSEPGCAVKAALEEGSLPPQRWESYVKLQKEIAFQRRKADPAAQAEERKRWKKIAKDLKKR